MKRRLWFGFLALAVILLMLASCQTPDVELSEADEASLNINTGMSLDDVIVFLGEPDTAGNEDNMIYEWTFDDQSILSVEFELLEEAEEITVSKINVIKITEK